MPTLTPADVFVKPGALMSYAAEFRPIFVGGTAYVKKILNGEKPGDIPRSAADQVRVGGRTTSPNLRGQISIGRDAKF